MPSAPMNPECRQAFDAGATKMESLHVMATAQAEQLSALVEKVGDVHAAVLGNGEPSKGLAVRVDRLETKGKAAAWVLALIIAVGGLAVGLLAALKT